MKSTIFPTREFNSLFDSLYRGSLGFENLFPVMQNPVKGTAFPPYNVQRDENNYTVTVAVAGYGKDDIVIEVESGNLVIRSVESEGLVDDAKEFLHRGIASRKWRLTFALSDQLIVDGAELKHGLLVISLVREEPEFNKETIKIK